MTNISNTTQLYFTNDLHRGLDVALFITLLLSVAFFLNESLIYMCRKGREMIMKNETVFDKIDRYKWNIDFIEERLRDLEENVNEKREELETELKDCKEKLLECLNEEQELLGKLKENLKENIRENIRENPDEEDNKKED